MKRSLLGEEEFRFIHGGGWVLMDGRCLSLSCCEKEQKEEVGERYKKWCNELKKDTDLYSLYKNKRNDFISEGRLGYRASYDLVAKSLKKIKEEGKKNVLVKKLGGLNLISMDIEKIPAIHHMIKSNYKKILKIR